MALDNPTTEVLVLEEDSQVVGTATLSYKVRPSYGMVGIIDDVVVDPAYQGRGFGRELTVHCINSARKKGCKSVELTSRTARATANALYQSLGFKQKETNVYTLKLY
jgi:ribosomal protein S18 acetylase RimI-like enzyme